ncbi:pyroglutamyl-peptidase I [Paenibacillus humicola]|uniref:pyroglutamyl-peptidase I n=1 Tax=Paenibacillus humicola TaxID=3110540 RepID=UPI00237BC0CF|nr:pyroglutamyl-peptidase I [Paenibacillus humicola]
MPIALVTGFEPFGGEPVNPSSEAVKRLAGKSFGETEVFVVTLPTVFGQSVRVLKEAMDEIRPDIVICVGQAGGRPDITVERVAINVDDAVIPDNDGNEPVDVPIVADGPAAYWSSLPIKAIVKNMREAGIPASVSQTAGTYVCNHLFYGLAHLIATEFPGVRGGFIHIPFLPEQAARRGGSPSMSLDAIVRSLEIAVQTTAVHKRDIVAAGGDIH